MAITEHSYLLTDSFVFGIEKLERTSNMCKNKNYRNRRTLQGTVVSLVALLISREISPARCFQKTTTRRRNRTTAVHFRSVDNPLASSAPSHEFLSTLLSVPPQRLPAWLSIPESHLAEKNLQRLRETMRESSFFTENESLKVLLAIEEAASGDRNMVAGAAEFCYLLQDTMELGFNALVAAAFHYSSCVTARQRQTWSLPKASYLLDSFGSHAVAIAEDAARLKQLEMVAATVTAAEPGTRVRPDTKDAENLRKLLLSETKDWRALAIRSGACLYRLRGILKNEDNIRTKEAARTAREALSIYAPLASRLGHHRLKNELEGSAFRILYPRQYKAVNSLTHENNGAGDIETGMQQVLTNVQEEMTSMLKQDDEFNKLVKDFSVTARVKEPYSMWRKMLRNGYKHILQVPDALAIRIVLDAKVLSKDEAAEVTRARERALCYYAQRLCTERWKPVPGNPRFKDYINSPKPNGYQSLHYTASTEWHGQEWTCEVQIRSGEMHKVAEFGLASHWDYKLASKAANRLDGSETASVEIDDSSTSYLRKLQQWHWQHHGGASKFDASPASSEPVTLSDIWQSRRRIDRIRERTAKLEPYLRALTAAQLDLAREHVFVFFGSKLLALPAGSCVLDALRAVNPANVRDEDLILNGATTSVTRLLQNGDVLSVPATVTA